MEKSNINKLVLENRKKEIENMNEKLLKRNKELETIFGDLSKNELILNNYKINLDKIIKKLII